MRRRSSRVRLGLLARRLESRWDHDGHAVGGDLVDLLEVPYRLEMSRRRLAGPFALIAIRPA
jgi:hypothetical protein